MSDKPRGEFLWPAEDGSVEQAAYEMLNGSTEEYRKECWLAIQSRLQHGQRAVELLKKWPDAVNTKTVDELFGWFFVVWWPEAKKLLKDDTP